MTGKLKVLHIVKTSDGAFWAANQAAELVRHGIEVHVALPAEQGRCVGYWERAGAIIHVAGLDFFVKRPWKLGSICENARRLVAAIKPDIIHSHFFGKTVLLRHALSGKFSGPIIFQVAGPLHLEHKLFRQWDLMSAESNSYWVASSRCILEHYVKAGVPRDKVYLSYHGGSSSEIAQQRTNALRSKLGIGKDEIVIGNINFMYPPKWFLGQTVGLKCHEDVIDALSIVARDRPDVVGILVGEAAYNAKWYEAKLKTRANRKAGSRIHFTGYMSPTDIAAAWADFDVAVHVPLSENCGGVLEPLLAGIPTIAGKVGGLPELVIEGVTGKTVPSRNPKALACAIHETLADLPRSRELAQTGRELVHTMFDVTRTAAEIDTIYRYLLDRRCELPSEFWSEDFVARHSIDATSHRSVRHQYA
jgi:glycosyltransferase involved in cell wall biosynthesis